MQNNQGKQDGALDLPYTILTADFQKEGYRYMNFGNSNEQGGRNLNDNIIAQKDKTWHINIKK